MKWCNMITLIGTGHIFDLSTALQTIFDEKQPELICVELDTQRYQALLIKQSNPDAYHQGGQNLPLIYRLLGRFQESMASEYGVIAGAEMLTAVMYAQSHNIPLEFIDMNAQEIFSNMWKSMPAYEKLKLFLSGLFGGLFVSKKVVEQELQNIQDNLDMYLEEIGKKFPTIKRTLIDERNQYMTTKLLQLQQQYTTIVVCVGDGHIPGMIQLLQQKNLAVDIIRLRQLRDMNTKPTHTDSAHFSVTYKGH